MNDIRKDLWTDLRRLTAARIGLQRSGASLATEPLLAFQLAHARARDAVYRRLDVNQLKDDLAALGLPVLTVESAAADRQLYLMRPDLGQDWHRKRMQHWLHMPGITTWPALSVMASRHKRCSFTPLLC